MWNAFQKSKDLFATQLRCNMISFYFTSSFVAPNRKYSIQHVQFGFECSYSSYLSARSQSNWPLPLYKTPHFQDEGKWETNPEKNIFIWTRMIYYFRAEWFTLILFLKQWLWNVRNGLYQLTGLVCHLFIPSTSTFKILDHKEPKNMNPIDRLKTS